MADKSLALDAYAPRKTASVLPSIFFALEIRHSLSIGGSLNPSVRPCFGPLRLFKNLEDDESSCLIGLDFFFTLELYDHFYHVSVLIIL